MCRVKIFISNQEPELAGLVQEMRDKQLDFDYVPTAGPATLVVDDRATYGAKAIKDMIARIAELERYRRKTG